MNRGATAQERGSEVLAVEARLSLYPSWLAMQTANAALAASFAQAVCNE
ncbi:MAG TPA: hypothetical protein VKY19_16745 [Ktedonosporobacter sp.]|nr:hypothetical protein [Ktedonosporobacter sp.]